jgi:hypothetical protein
MAKETRDSSTAMDEYLDGTLFKVIRENEKFLDNNVEEAYSEVVGLVNDAIKCLGLAVKDVESQEDRVSLYLERSMAFFFYHVLSPFSCAIFTDVLTGNVPACFMELRLMLESLAKCYFADSKYSERTFFQERLELLEEEWSTSRLLRELGRELGLGNRFVALWGKLSRGWVHTKGIMDKFVGQIEKSNVPRWALVIPVNYTENDLDALEELRKRISQFRELLAAIVEKYQQEPGFCASSPLPSDGA